MSYHIVRHKDDSITVTCRESGQTVELVGEAAEEQMRLFRILCGTDEPSELGKYYGITFKEDGDVK